MEISTNWHWSDPNVNIPTWKLTICPICANNWNHSLGICNRVHRCKSVETGNFGRVRIHTELELPRIFLFYTFLFPLGNGHNMKHELDPFSTIRCSVPQTNQFQGVSWKGFAQFPLGLFSFAPPCNWTILIMTLWKKSKDNGYHFHVHTKADSDLVEMKGKVEMKKKPLLLSLSKPKFQMRFYQLKTNKCPRIQIYFDLLKLI